jgi:hypothetical protein
VYRPASISILSFLPHPHIHSSTIDREAQRQGVSPCLYSVLSFPHPHIHSSTIDRDARRQGVSPCLYLRPVFSPPSPHPFIHHRQGRSEARSRKAFRPSLPPLRHNLRLAHVGSLLPSPRAFLLFLVSCFLFPPFFFLRAVYRSKSSSPHLSTTATTPRALRFLDSRS